MSTVGINQKKDFGFDSHEFKRFMQETFERAHTYTSSDASARNASEKVAPQRLPTSSENSFAQNFINSRAAESSRYVQIALNGGKTEEQLRYELTKQTTQLKNFVGRLQSESNEHDANRPTAAYVRMLLRRVACANLAREKAVDALEAQSDNIEQIQPAPVVQEQEARALLKTDAASETVASAHNSSDVSENESESELQMLGNNSEEPVALEPKKSIFVIV